MSYKKALITYALAATTALTPLIPTISYAEETKLAATTVASGERDADITKTLEKKEKADKNLEQKVGERKHFYAWFYDNWLGRTTSAVIIIAIGAGIYYATKKDPPPPPPTSDPPKTPSTEPPDGDDKNPEN